MQKYDVNEIEIFCKYFKIYPNNTYKQFLIDTFDNQYSQETYNILIDSIRKRLQRDKILISEKYNDNSGYFTSKKNINTDKLFSIYNIII